MTHMKRLRLVRLERRLVISMVVASSLVTAVLTIVSIFADYRSGMARQKTTATSVQNSIARPLASLLHSGDEGLIGIYARSVLANPEVLCIEVDDTYSNQPTKQWCNGVKPIFTRFTVQFPLEFRGFDDALNNGATANSKTEHLGTARITFSDRYVVDGVRTRIFTFFATQALKTFIVSLFILAIIRSLVMQHLSSIFNYFRHYSGRYKGQQLTLSGKNVPPEFDLLARSINQMVGSQEQVIAVAAEREHSYNQLAKVFYPHQLERMREGHSLESTMPVGRAQGTVVAFDIVGSSRYQGPHFKEFFHRLVSTSNDAMMANYDPATLCATAYRVKVMGDGFLCSVGYPFKQPVGKSPQDVAVSLAQTLVNLTVQVGELCGLTEVMHCGVGIAMGEIETFFPDSNPSEYDLFGTPLVHAVRYESTRRLLFKEFGKSGSIIILQASVFDCLSPELKRDFQRFELKNWKVRDDQTASCLYYQFFPASAKAFGSHELPTSA